MKIKSLKVQPQGPLREKLEISPKGLNLIYGRNETGKTFLLETMAAWLFGKGKNSPLKKVSRNWDPVPNGSIEVTGVQGAEGSRDMLLDSTSKKNLQDYFVDELAMPADLSELLLVRAGESLLENPDDLVKRSLSASGMLQEIIDESKVSRTLQRATVTEGLIHGNNAGEIRKRNEWKNRLTLLKELRHRYAQEHGGELDGLEEDISRVEGELNQLKTAKRSKAYQISQEVSALQEKIRGQPQDLDELEDMIDRIERVRSELSEKKNRVAFLTDELKHKDWADHACTRYRELQSVQNLPPETIRTSNPLFLILSFVCLIGAGILYFTAGLWGALGGVMASLAFFMLWLLVKKEEAGKPSLEDPDMEKIRAEFREKFGDELISEAFFQNKLESLILYQGQREESLRDLAELRNKEIELHARLETRLGKHPDGSELAKWSKQVSSWKKILAGLEETVQLKRSELDRLGIEDDEFLSEDSSMVWDSNRFEELEEELKSLNRRSHQSQVEQGKLKTEIAAMTQNNTGYWEELISGMEEKIGEAEKKYQEITAEILGKIAVVSTVRELQEKEDEMIAQNLENSQFNADIQEISGGRVNEFAWEGGELKVVREGLGKFSREFLATGANEQLMIALRTLFARHYLGETPCFLLLDDAFQNSDWERRELLVEHLIRLVRESGWQVFYFTMDDHLRELFQRKARDLLPNEFEYLELASV